MPQSTHETENDAKGMSNQEYEAYISWEVPFIETWHVEIQKIIVDEVKHSATVWATYDFIVKGQTKNTRLEFVSMLDFDGDGKVVEKIVEFVDSAEVKKFETLLLSVAKT